MTDKHGSSKIENERSIVGDFAWKGETDRSYSNSILIMASRCLDSGESRQRYCEMAISEKDSYPIRCTIIPWPVQFLYFQITEHQSWQPWFTLSRRWTRCCIHDSINIGVHRFDGFDSGCAFRMVRSRRRTFPYRFMVGHLSPGSWTSTWISARSSWPYLGIHLCVRNHLCHIPDTYCQFKCDGKTGQEKWVSYWFRQAESTDSNEACPRLSRTWFEDIEISTVDDRAWSYSQRRL